MNWVKEAKHIFMMGKPEHFTDYKHCEECADHDETLRNTDVDSISIEELGRPGWDPICFCSNEGKRYYMPAFVRLSLETVRDDFYFSQFLFHLENDGLESSLSLSCSNEQRHFVASFIEYMINAYSKEIDDNLCTDEALKVYEIWAIEKLPASS